MTNNKVRYLTTEQAATRIDCHEQTIRNMLDDGRLWGFHAPLPGRPVAIHPALVEWAVRFQGRSPTEQSAGQALYTHALTGTGPGDYADRTAYYLACQVGLDPTRLDQMARNLLDLAEAVYHLRRDVVGATTGHIPEDEHV